MCPKITGQNILIFFISLLVITNAPKSHVTTKDITFEDGAQTV
jgi:hypothetical protein